MFFNSTLVEKQEAICSAGIFGLDIGWSPKGLAICSEFGLGWAKQCVRILVGHGQIVTTKRLLNTNPHRPRGMLVRLQCDGSAHRF